MRKLERLNVKIEMCKNLFYNRESEEQIEFHKIYMNLVDSIPKDLLKHLSMFGFILFKPDAYLRGLIPQIVTFLIEKKIFPVRFKLQMINTELIDELYLFVKKKYLDSWWIMEKVYRLAPVCPMIVIGESDKYDHLCAKVRDAIGPTTPLLGGPDQVRYKYGASHRIFNLIHGTDDPATAIREALIFFPMFEIQSALEQASYLLNANCSFNYERHRELLNCKPSKEVDLSYSRAKQRIKELVMLSLSKVLKELRSILKEREEYFNRMHNYLDALDSFASGFMSCLAKELSIIQRNYPLRIEYRNLLEIYDLEKIILSLFLDKIKILAQRGAREIPDGEQKKYLLNGIEKLKKGIYLCRRLSDDVQFKEVELAEFLADLYFFKLELSNFDKIVLESAWSVLSTEFSDRALKTTNEVRK